MMMMMMVSMESLLNFFMDLTQKLDVRQIVFRPILDEIIEKTCRAPVIFGHNIKCLLHRRILADFIHDRHESIRESIFFALDNVDDLSLHPDVRSP